MGDSSLVEMVDEPVTVSSLVDDFRDLGVAAGDTLLVHSSLSTLGWVAGGPQAVVDALQGVLTESGTLVMPTYTPQYSDPAGWSNPPVPEEWYERIRESRPPYRPAVTPSWSIGQIAECFRDYPGAVRSEHPTFSFAGWGADAAAIVADHEFDYGLGEGSPLARVYERDGDVLMLGTGYDTNTSLHLAEHRGDFPKETATTEVPVLEDGERVTVEYEDIKPDSSDFEAVGADFEDDHEIARGSVGAADATLVSQRALVDFAVEWFERNR